MNMKIQNINNYYIQTSFTGLKLSKKENNKNYKNATLPSLEKPCSIDLQRQREDEFFTKFLNKKGKLSLEEYKEIKKHHPSAIIKAYKYVEKNSTASSRPEQIARAAIKLKEKYDNDYKNNYTILSIGTSPAPITELMSSLGSRVVFMPISGLKKLDTNNLYILRKHYPTIASRHTNIRHSLDYARKRGLFSKKEDFILLLDYCCSGTSLNNMCDIFLEEFPYHSEKTHERSILDDLAELTNLKDPSSNLTIADYANLTCDMQGSFFEEVSNVPHFYIYDQYNEGQQGCISSVHKKKRQLFKEFDEFSTPLARAYSLCCINEAMKILEN